MEREFNLKIIRLVGGFLLWTVVIHFIDDNLQAFLLLLAIGCNCYMATWWIYQRDDPKYFAYYIVHILVANILFMGYIAMSVEPVINTVDMWRRGFFGLPSPIPPVPCRLRELNRELRLSFFV